MLRKFIEIFTNYYCSNCGCSLGSTDNGDDTNDRSFTCSDCG